MSNGSGLFVNTPGGNVLAVRLASAAPGTGSGVTFLQFDQFPALSDLDQVTFGSQLQGTGVSSVNRNGVWSGPLGNPGLVMRLNDIAPGTGGQGRYGQQLVQPGVNSSGTLAFAETLVLPGGAANSGVWSGQPSNIQLLARTGMPAPGTEPGTTFETLYDGHPLVDASGRVTFRASVAGASVTTTTRTGIWTARADQPATLNLLIRGGIAAPGTEAGTVFSGFGESPMKPTGTIAFYGALDGPSIQAGVNDGEFWSGSLDAPGNFHLVARKGQQAPGLAPGVVFQSVGQFTAGSAGQTVFQTALAGPNITNGVNNNALWIESNGALTRIAQSGDPAPGTNGITFAGLGSPLIDAAGDVVFMAGLNNSTNGTQGIWVFRPGLGLDLVARVGGSILCGDGVSRGITALGVLGAGFSQPTPNYPTGLSDTGYLAFNADFQNSHGVFVVQIPAPAGAATLATLAGAFLTRRRRNS